MPEVIDSLRRKDSLEGRGLRLPADTLEQVVAHAIRNKLSGSEMAALVPDAQVETLKRLHGLKEAEQIQLFELLSRTVLKEGVLSLQLDADVLARTIDVDPSKLNEALLIFEVPFTCRRRGVETRFVMAGASTNTDGTLIANIARAHDWLERIKNGEALNEIACAEATTTKRVQQILEFAFLAPDIVREVLAGNQPLGLTTTWIATHTIPTDWVEQRELFSTL